MSAYLLRYDSRMSRLRPLTEDLLDEDQQRFRNMLLSGPRGSGMVDAQGALIGPFNAMLYQPLIGERLIALGEQLLSSSGLARELAELAILVTSAYWQANVEWWAHSTFARRAGLGDETIASIASGDEPRFSEPAQRCVYRYTRALLTDRRVDDETYHDAIELLGEALVTELTTLVGYYSLISLLLNAFRVPVPPGVTARWPD
jgi:4-carboxymuconolactone decarboxylase